MRNKIKQILLFSLFSIFITSYILNRTKFDLISLVILLPSFFLLLKVKIVKNITEMNEAYVLLIATSSFTLGTLIGFFEFCFYLASFLLNSFPCLLTTFFTQFTTTNQLNECFAPGIGFDNLGIKSMVWGSIIFIPLFFILIVLFVYLFHSVQITSTKISQKQNEKFSSSFLLVVIIALACIFIPIVSRLIQIRQQTQLINNAQYDENIIETFGNISQSINRVSELNKPLPKKLQDIPKNFLNSSLYMDIQTKKTIGYKILSSNKYQLCATFKNNLNNDSQYLHKNNPNSIFYIDDLSINNITYAKGYYCIPYVLPVFNNGNLYYNKHLSPNDYLPVISPEIYNTILCRNQQYVIHWKAKNTIQLIQITLWHKNNPHGYDIVDIYNNPLSALQAQKTWEALKGSLNENTNIFLDYAYLWNVGKTVFNDQLVDGTGYYFNVTGVFTENGKQFSINGESHPFSIEDCKNN